MSNSCKVILLTLSECVLHLELVFLFVLHLLHSESERWIHGIGTTRALDATRVHGILGKHVACFLLWLSQGIASICSTSQSILVSVLQESNLVHVNCSHRAPSRSTNSIYCRWRWLVIEKFLFSIIIVRLREVVIILVIIHIEPLHFRYFVCSINRTRPFPVLEKVFWSAHELDGIAVKVVILISASLSESAAFLFVHSLNCWSCRIVFILIRIESLYSIWGHEIPRNQIPAACLILSKSSQIINLIHRRLIKRIGFSVFWIKVTTWWTHWLLKGLRAIVAIKELHSIFLLKCIALIVHLLRLLL